MVCPGCAHEFIWSDRFHAGDTFIIYDLETTGLYPDEDEFIQIAAVRYQGGCLIGEDSFFSFARPRRPISSFIESYTGIGNRHVAGAPRPEEVLCRFSQWAGEGTLIAHNGLRFDSKFLAATCRRHGLSARAVDCIDSIHISKMLFGKTRGTGHSFDHVKSRLGLHDMYLKMNKRITVVITALSILLFLISCTDKNKTQQIGSTAECIEISNLLSQSGYSGWELVTDTGRAPRQQGEEQPPARGPRCQVDRADAAPPPPSSCRSPTPPPTPAPPVSSRPSSHGATHRATPP